MAACICVGWIVTRRTPGGSARPAAGYVAGGMGPTVESEERSTGAPVRFARAGPDAPAPGMRRRLAFSVASAAGPYGYTISLGGSIALANERLGSPHLAGALLLMLGAVAAFVALGTGAQGSIAPRALPSAQPTVWGNAHVLSAGLALCAVWGVDDIVSGAAGWLATGFAATCVYLAGCAAQQAVVARLRGDRDRA